MPKMGHHRGKDLSPGIRGEILGMHEAGMSYGSIAKELNKSRGTVQMVVKRYGDCCL